MDIKRIQASIMIDLLRGKSLWKACHGMWYGQHTISHFQKQSLTGTWVGLSYFFFTQDKSHRAYFCCLGGYHEIAGKIPILNWSGCSFQHLYCSIGKFSCSIFIPLCNFVFTLCSNGYWFYFPVFRILFLFGSWWSWKGTCCVVGEHVCSYLVLAAFLPVTLA